MQTPAELKIETQNRHLWNGMIRDLHTSPRSEIHSDCINISEFYWLKLNTALLWCRKVSDRCLGKGFPTQAAVVLCS